MPKLVIYGAGGFAREVHEFITALPPSARTECAGFLVDEQYRDTDALHGLPVLGDERWLAGNRGFVTVVAIGDSAARRRVADRLERLGAEFATLVHPLAWLGGSVSVGPGTIIGPFVSATADITIGGHCQLHAGARLGHDTHLDDCVTILPGATVSGHTAIGAEATLGAGSVILPGVRIGRRATIGAGAVVTRDVPENATVAGVPARAMPEKARPA